MDSMVEVLANYAQKQTDSIFIADNSDNVFTYGETWKNVKIVAETLKTVYGIKTMDKVMVECNQDAWFLIVDFACELIGAIFVPIENNASYDRKKTIYEETQSKIWIAQVDKLDFIDSISYEELKKNKKGLYDCNLPKGNEIAEILYTTGTTGKSKGIMITNSANVALAENIKYGVDMKKNNTELIPIPISHSHGIRCCYANLLNGGTIVLIDGLLRIKKVFELMDQYKVTSLDVSPSAAALLIKVSKGLFWEYGRNLDYIQIGTAALPEKLKKELVEELPGVHLYNFYGSTESGRSCVLDFSVDKGKSNCIGKVTRNAKIVFTDDNRNIIEATEENPGLLASKGNMNMLGYWNNLELTSEVMRDNFIFTNDLGYMDKEGYVYILGRKDDVINYNGIKISPDEIEEVAVQYSGIKDAACVPIPDSVIGQIPKLFIALESSDGSFDMKEYIKYLTTHLDGNKMPKKVEIINAIPRTYNGKIKRKELIEQ